jgi:hypothetical protein
MARCTWFFSVSYTNMSDCHDVAEIMLKVALDTHNYHFEIIFQMFKFSDRPMNGNGNKNKII